MRMTLEPWGQDDLDVLRRANTPELTRFLGGPEDDAALVARHEEYLAGDGVRMFRIEVDGASAGYAGWWEEKHDGAPAYEVGCVVEPAWQGHGVGSMALAEVVRRAVAGGRVVVGYADVGNAASHALCRRVGFALEGTGVFPADDGGDATTVNIWVIRPHAVTDAEPSVRAAVRRPT
jgi:RimJ/RimL family protein N-acetyltransferase